MKKMNIKDKKAIQDVYDYFLLHYPSTVAKFYIDKDFTKIEVISYLLIDYWTIYKEEVTKKVLDYFVKNFFPTNREETFNINLLKEEILAEDEKSDIFTPQIYKEIGFDVFKIDYIKNKIIKTPIQTNIFNILNKKVTSEDEVEELARYAALKDIDWDFFLEQQIPPTDYIFV